MNDSNQNTDHTPNTGSDRDQVPSRIVIQSSAQFVDALTPPDYLIEPILQRGYLYSLTSPTGGGKTTVALRFLASVPLGASVGRLQCEQAGAIMFCGENPDDVRARWIALADEMGFDARTINVSFIPGVFPLAELREQAERRARDMSGLGLVLVDTAAAYFDGNDENDNVQQGRFMRKLRQFTQLPGNPTTLVNCHPTKHATNDGLLPRGAGASVNEVDGNLTLEWVKPRVHTKLHWQGKFRGPDFAPVHFDLATVTHPGLISRRGLLIPTVVARPLDTAPQKGNATDLMILLNVMAANPDVSIAALGDKAFGKNSKSKVHRLLEELHARGFAEKGDNGHWRVTSAGLAARTLQ